MKIYLSVFAVLMTFCPVYGGIIYPNAPQYSAGQGINEATIVIDFDAGNYFTFKYKWDGTGNRLGCTGSDRCCRCLDVKAKWYPEFNSHFVNDFVYPGGNKFDYGLAFTGWGYWGSSDGESWLLNAGVDGRQLVNGSWDSWIWSNYDFSVSWDPIRSPGVSPIPEPASISLLCLGIGLLLEMRKSRS